MKKKNVIDFFNQMKVNKRFERETKQSKQKKEKKKKIVQLERERERGLLINFAEA